MNCRENQMSMARLVCPKPRRVGPSDSGNHMIMPLKFRLRDDVDAFDPKGGAELIDLIIDKGEYKTEKCVTLSSSPPFYLGSPPCRAPNPLVQDSQFGVENLFSKYAFSPSDSVLPSSVHTRAGSKQATVRVEGFDSKFSCCYGVNAPP